MNEIQYLQKSDSNEMILKLSHSESTASNQPTPKTFKMIKPLPMTMHQNGYVYQPTPNTEKKKENPFKMLSYLESNHKHFCLN